MSNNKRLNLVLQVVLFLLFAGWLLLFIINPVRMYPDSYGYFTDSDHLFDPGYQTIRPVLYPLFLRIFRAVPVKMSIIAYLLNCASLLWLVGTANATAATLPKQRLFSLRNTIVLIAFFMLVGIWSYCGTYLTEAILLPVHICIFIFLYKIFFPPKRPNIFLMILYAAGICLLATILKPWIMIAILLTGGLLFMASVLIKAFRAKLVPSFVLLSVGLLTFFGTLKYNRSKSFEKANIVVFIIGSGFEDVLKDRIATDKTLGKDDAGFIANILSDIDLINHKYNRDPWAASRSNDLAIMNIFDTARAADIDKAYHVMYFQRFGDFMRLIGLAVERHVSNLRLDTSCLEIAYGPELPGLRNLSVILIVAFSILLVIYQATRRRSDGAGKIGLKPVKTFLKENILLSIFIGAVLVAGIGFSLLLTLAGAFELQRTVLPAAIFQIVAIAFIVMQYRPSAAYKS